MSFDQDPNEQAQISGSDLAELIDEIKRCHAQRDELLAVMAEYIAAGDNVMHPPDGDYMAALCRRGIADKAAREAINREAA